MSDDTVRSVGPEVELLISAARYLGILQAREEAALPIADTVESARESMGAAHSELMRRISAITTMAGLHKAAMDRAGENADFMRRTITELRSVVAEYQRCPGGAAGLAAAIDRAAAMGRETAAQCQLIEALRERLRVGERSHEILIGQRNAAEDRVRELLAAQEALTSQVWDRTGGPPRTPSSGSE